MLATGYLSGTLDVGMHFYFQLSRFWPSRVCIFQLLMTNGVSNEIIDLTVYLGLVLENVSFLETQLAFSNDRYSWPTSIQNACL